jgi:N-acetylglucosamine-6-phosphate deacetylase
MNDKNVTCEIICDFFHVHPAVVKLLYDVKGCDKITVITDAEVGTGMPDGEYNVNGRILTVKEGKTYTEDGTIAGGTSVMLDGVRNLVSIGVPLEEAVKCASFNGAAAAGLEKRIGSLDVGKNADIVLLNKNLDVVKVFVGGKSVV